MGAYYTNYIIHVNILKITWVRQSLSKLGERNRSKQAFLSYWPYFIPYPIVGNRVTLLKYHIGYSRTSPWLWTYKQDGKGKTNKKVNDLHKKNSES